MKFSIGDVLYVHECEYRQDAILLIVDITLGSHDGYCTTHNDGIFYHVKVLEGDSHYNWFMEDSPIFKQCSLMVSNLNEAERLAMIL